MLDFNNIFPINSNKPISLLLSNIHGVGLQLGIKLCKRFGLSPNELCANVPMSKKRQLINYIEKSLIIGPYLEQKVIRDKRAKVLGKSFQGNRLTRGLPTRGQRTRSNGRTQGRHPFKGR